MNMCRILAALLAVFMAGGAVPSSYAADASWNLANDEADDYRPAGIGKIQTVVVIFPENRSFDNLWGTYPGADGVTGLKPEAAQQVDRDGKVLASLPKIWGGITKGGPETLPGGLPNAPFAIDDPKGFNCPPARPPAILCIAFIRTRCRSMAARTTGSSPGAIAAPWLWGITTARTCRCPNCAEICARRQLLPGRFRRLVPQSPMADVRLYAVLSRCRYESPASARSPPSSLTA